MMRIRSQPALRVYRMTWARVPLWNLVCDLCDEMMEFAAWQDAQDYAQAHAMKHDERSCPTCGHRPYIREDWV